MTATSTTNASGDHQQPVLYRLAHQSRWSSSFDLTSLYDRLLYLSTLHSSSSPASAPETTSGTENVRVMENDDTTSHSSNSPLNEPNEHRNRKGVLSELHYADVRTQRTALHILCYWRPKAHLVSHFLTMAPHLVWARSSSGETALHMACSNTTRMACSNAVERLLGAAEMATVGNDGGSADDRRRRRYALLTDDRGWTALHCAVQADAPTSVLKILLDAAPDASIMAELQTKGPKRQTPIDLLYQTYELFIEQYLQCENESSRDSSSDNGGSSTNQESDNDEEELPDTLRHFWNKLTILLRAGCQSIHGSANDADCLPMLHASLMLLSTHHIQMPPVLLQFVMKRCLDCEANVPDARGNYPLHYGVRALARDNTVDAGTVQTILEANTNAARIHGSDGHYPLRSLLATIHNAESAGSGRINALIQDMARACPPAMFGISAAWSDELAPHIIAMLCRPNKDRSAGLEDRKKLDNTCIFELLRTEPGLMKNV